MPIFDFICPACKYQVELIVSSSNMVVGCPECGNDAMVKELSKPAPPQFKGGSPFSASARIKPIKE